MLFKESFIWIDDRSGPANGKVIHLYLQKKKIGLRVGLFFKFRVRAVKKKPAYIRGKRYRPYRVGYVSRALYTTNVKKKTLNNSNFLTTHKNCAVLFKRRGVIKSRHIDSILLRPCLTSQYFDKMVMVV